MHVLFAASYFKSSLICVTCSLFAMFEMYRLLIKSYIFQSPFKMDVISLQSFFYKEIRLPECITKWHSCN